MPQPGVEPGFQSSQDCVLSIERLEHYSMQYMKLFSKNKLFLAICNHFHIVYQANNQKKLLFLLLKNHFYLEKGSREYENKNRARKTYQSRLKDWSIFLSLWLSGATFGCKWGDQDG